MLYKPPADTDPETMPIPVGKHRRPPNPPRRIYAAKPRRVPLRTAINDGDPLTFWDEMLLLACGGIFGGFFGIVIGLVW